MGLDMYLKKKTFIGNYYRKPDKQVKVIIPENEEDNLFPINNIETKRISEIIEQVGYWRKANQIHNWFVNNVQDGEDNCLEYYVEKEKLEELLDICKKIKQNCPLVDGMITKGYTYIGKVKTPIVGEGKEIENIEFAKELLPTLDGCFFGNTDYNQFYIDDINDTIEILEPLIKDDSGSFYYCSSW